MQTYLGEIEMIFDFVFLVTHTFVLCPRSGVATAAGTGQEAASGPNGGI